MILTIDIFNSFCEYAKSNVVGTNPMAEFNNKLNESQKEVMDLVAPGYDKTERVRTLLQPFVITASGTASGTFSKPSNMYRVLGLSGASGGKNFPIFHAKENELIEYSFIPQRKADITRGIVYYKQGSGSITLIPNSSISYTMFYLKNPTNANLEFTYTALPSSEMALTPTGIVNLEWNADAFNIILYKLLQKYGLVTRDEFMTQVANYGIDSDVLNID